VLACVGEVKTFDSLTATPLASIVWEYWSDHWSRLADSQTGLPNAVAANQCSGSQPMQWQPTNAVAANQCSGSQPMQWHPTNAVASKVANSTIVLMVFPS